MSRKHPDLEKAPDRCLKSNVAVVCQGCAIQLVPSRDELLPLKETELCLQQRQNALISALQVVHCQAPGCPARQVTRRCQDMVHRSVRLRQWNVVFHVLFRSEQA